MSTATARGLTLLEVLVALVILGLVALGYLQLFHGSHRLVASSREWSDAVAYAQDAVERTKLDSLSLRRAAAESLPGGFRRQITSRPWQPGLMLVTVTVFLPGGGRFDLDRLARVAPAARPGAVTRAVPPSVPW